MTTKRQIADYDEDTAWALMVMTDAGKLTKAQRRRLHYEQMTAKYEPILRIMGWREVVQASWRPNPKATPIGYTHDPHGAVSNMSAYQCQCDRCRRMAERLGTTVKIRPVVFFPVRSWGRLAERLLKLRWFDPIVSNDTTTTNE